MNDAQVQEQLQRSLQASKQMVYGVYENILGDLEELERREETVSGKSAIEIPDQSKKNDLDVQSIVGAQLIIFETQLKACPREVYDEVRYDLVIKTLNWSAARAEKNFPVSKIDVFAAQLVELVHTGTIQRPGEVEKSPNLHPSEMQDAFVAFVIGQHQQRKLDAEFKDDPNKKAELKTIRRGKTMEAGIDRMFEVRPQLQELLQHYRQDCLN